MRRVNVLVAQATVAAAELAEIPEVEANRKALVQDGANYLAQLKVEYPDIFYFKYKDGRRELVTLDTTLYEEVLANDNVYGTPGEAEHMKISQQIFGMPDETMAKHLHHFAGGVKRLNQDTAEDVVAPEIARRMEADLATWPSEGEYDIQMFSDVVFWGMVETLFGPVASKKINPTLPDKFVKIDDKLFKVLRSGKPDPEVRAGVDVLVDLFLHGIDDGTANGPLVKMYSDILEGEAHQKEDAARMCVTAWWGGLGNTLPNTINTLAYILGTPGVKENAVLAVDGEGEFGADGGKRYLTACLREALRLCAPTTANRTVKQTHEVIAQSGKRYRLEQGMDLILHFVSNHYDPAVYANPTLFDPSRFLGKTADEDAVGTVIKGKRYAWAPFSGGAHRCSGYALVMEEIPAALQVFLRHFHLELTEPLPPFDYNTRFHTKDIKIGFRRRF